MTSGGDGVMGIGTVRKMIWNYKEMERFRGYGRMSGSLYYAYFRSTMPPQPLPDEFILFLGDGDSPLILYWRSRQTRKKG